MQSSAPTASTYLQSLPPDRPAALRAVRAVIRKNLPAGYKEAMNWGMVTYQVPLRTFPDTYNGRPLMYAALASQKNYMVVYLTGIYTSPAKYEAFKKAYKATGKRWDVGKSCVRFRALDDLPLELIGTTIASIPLDAFVQQFTKGRATRSKRSTR